MKNPDYLKRIPERFGFVPKLATGPPVIWLHAVSVGEAQASRALVARLGQAFPGCQLVMTTITPTGACYVQQTFPGEVIHLYLPYDLPCAVKAFLDAVRPRVLIIMETEIWPNLLYYCRRRDLPAVLINARLSDKSYKSYLRFRAFLADALRGLSHIAAQSDADAHRFLSLGARPDDVSVTGNLKFDIEMPHGVAGQAKSLKRFLSVNRPVWIAASTHEGEEELVLEAFHEIRKKSADCLLIIAPRHPERFRVVYNLCRSKDFITVRRTEEQLYSRNTDIYMLNTLGELPLFYGCADLAFIGGSLVPAGGHNMVEAARWGIPVITGPHTFNFREITGSLKGLDALIVVAAPDELAASVIGLLADAGLRRGYGERGKQVVEQNQGATDSVMTLLGNYINSV